MRRIILRELFLAITSCQRPSSSLVAGLLETELFTNLFCYTSRRCATRTHVAINLMGKHLEMKPPNENELILLLGVYSDSSQCIIELLASVCHHLSNPMGLMDDFFTCGFLMPCLSGPNRSQAETISWIRLLLMHDPIRSGTLSP